MSSLPRRHAKAVAVVMQDWRDGDGNVALPDADDVLNTEVDRLRDWLHDNPVTGTDGYLPVLNDANTVDLVEDRIAKADSLPRGHEDRVRALAQAVTILRGTVRRHERLLGRTGNGATDA